MPQVYVHEHIKSSTTQILSKLIQIDVKTSNNKLILDQICGDKIIQLFTLTGNVISLRRMPVLSGQLYPGLVV